jgi:hypothetical protein
MTAMQFLPAPETLVATFAAFAVSLACLWLLLLPRGRRLMLDRPNARSLHQQPVPRSGGIAIAAGVAAGVALAPAVSMLAFCLAAALAVVSLADDIRALPTLLRLAAHVAAAAVLLAAGIGSTEPAAFLALVLAIAWYANLYNFMDGADGLAGGMACSASAPMPGPRSNRVTLRSRLRQRGSQPVARLPAVQLPPARLFMGDAGSVPLGFLAGALGVTGWHEGVWPPVVPGACVCAFRVRCDVDAGEAPAARRTRLASAQGALLSAPGADGIRAPWHRVDRVWRDGGLHDARAARARSRVMPRSWARWSQRRLRSARSRSGSTCAGPGTAREETSAHEDAGLCSLSPTTWSRRALPGWLRFWLRFNLEVPPEFLQTAWSTLPWVMAIHALLFWRLGLYRGLWRYASLPDLQKILLAAALLRSPRRADPAAQAGTRGAAHGVPDRAAAADRRHERQPAALPRLEGTAPC